MRKITLCLTLLSFVFSFAQNGGADCASAVTVGENASLTATDVAATGGDAWFVVTPASSGTLTISSCGDTEDTIFQVYDECAGSILADDDDFCGLFAGSQVELAVTAGEDYFIRWYDQWSPGPFDWTTSLVTCVAPTATGAVDTVCVAGEYFVDVNITDLGDSANLTISNDFDANTVNVSATGTYQVGPFPALTAVTVTVAHETSTDCDVVLGPYFYGCNDECTGAFALTQETGIADASAATPVAGSLEGATDSGLAAEECAGFTGTANDDVWYSFEALTSDVTITFEAYNFDAVVQVYSGTCGALVNIGCSDASVTGSPAVEEVSLTSLNVGETYYARIYQYGTGSTVGDNFDVKLWSTTTLSTELFEDEGAFKYFPNPVSSSLSLRAQKNIQNVDIYNVMGQRVMNARPDAISSDIDMSSLSVGTYFVQVTIDDVTETIRVVRK